jgi:hypothetical protein
MDFKLIETRQKQGLCIECGIPDKVHYSSRCLDCHKLAQNELLGWQIEFKKKQLELQAQKDRVDKQFEKITSFFRPQNQLHTPKSTNLSKEPDWNIIFLTFVVSAFAVVGFLRLSGAFDNNFKSESEIRIDLYSECLDMNGINCQKLLSP